METGFSKQKRAPRTRAGAKNKSKALTQAFLLQEGIAFLTAIFK